MEVVEKFWDLLSRGNDDICTVKADILDIFYSDEQRLYNYLVPQVPWVSESDADAKMLNYISKLAHHGGIIKPDAAIKIFSSITKADISNLFPYNLEFIADELILLGGDSKEYQKILDLTNSKVVLQNFWNSVKNGKYNPSYSPEKLEKNWEYLEVAISKGVFSLEELCSVIQKLQMKTKKEECERIEINFKNYQRPFGAHKSKKYDSNLVDYGFHNFVGRIIFDDGERHFCSYGGGDGILGFPHLDLALQQIVDSVLKGETVLFSKDAGRRNIKGKSEGVYLKALKQEQIVELKDMFYKTNYAKLFELKSLENPFEYQP